MCLHFLFKWIWRGELYWEQGKGEFFPFERQNLRLAGFGGYLYYVLFLVKRGGSKLSSLDFSLNSHRILRQPNDIPYVKLCYYGEEKRDRISLGSMSGPELTLMSWLAWNSKSSCFHHWSICDYRNNHWPSFKSTLNTGLVSRIRRKHQLSPLLLLFCFSSKVPCSLWLLEGSQYMSTDKKLFIMFPTLPLKELWWLSIP